MGRLARLLGTQPPLGRTLDGFVDSLLQTFENSRPGLTAEMPRRGRGRGLLPRPLREGGPRLREKVDRLAHLSADGAAGALPARRRARSARSCCPPTRGSPSAFTPRERNDFYLAPEELHGLERLGWGVAGLACSAASWSWAPFIPIWSKEWVLVFGVGGLVFPSVRRFFALRRYKLGAERPRDPHRRRDLAARPRLHDRGRGPRAALAAAAGRGATPDAASDRARRRGSRTRPVPTSSRPRPARDERVKEGDR